MSKEGFVEAVRVGVRSTEARERMAGGDFSDVPEAELDDHERSLLQAAAQEILENSEVEGFVMGSISSGQAFTPAGPTSPWGTYTPTYAESGYSVQQAMDYMQQ
jgi:hypothetical protein